MSLVACLSDFHSIFKQLLFTDEFIKISQLVSRQLMDFFFEFALSGAAFFEQLLQLQSEADYEAQQDNDLHLEVCAYFTDEAAEFSD